MKTASASYRVSESSAPMCVTGLWDGPVWSAVTPLTIAFAMGCPPAHRPNTQAKLLWTNDALHLLFRVEDRYVLAAARHDQDPVCKDSCVEFFFTPGDVPGLSYFNLEMNCGGTRLFWWHPEGQLAIPVAPEDCHQVKIHHALPKRIIPEIRDPVTWTLECRLPFSVLLKYCPNARKPAPGVCWRANFFKCADGSSHPHWLTWSFVDHPVPKFHLPQYFGTLEFASALRA